MKIRSLTALIGAASLLALPLALAGSQAPAGAASTLTGTSVAITDDGGSNYPQVSGDWVTYEDDSSGAEVVGYYNLTSGVTGTIPLGSEYADEEPAISGTTVVYTDEDLSGTENIYAYDIGSGNPPVALDPEADVAQDSPAIGGDTVAWVDNGCEADAPASCSDPVSLADPQIMVYDTSTESLTDLSDSPSTVNQQPSVSPDGSVVVWSQCDNGTDAASCEIMQAVLGAGGSWTVSQLTSASGGIAGYQSPQTDGSIVVYESQLAVSNYTVPGNIYWQPVGGGTQQEVPLPAGYSEPQQPSTSGGLISYYTQGTAQNLWVYSIATQQTYQPTQASDVDNFNPEMSVTPDGVARLVWWTYGATGSNVSGFVFSVPQAAQAISLTAPAAGVYGGSAVLSATGGGSGNPVTISVDQSSGAGVCSLSGDTVSYTGVGNCVIDANQAGSLDYAAAPQASQTIAVGPAPQTISFTAPSTGLAGGSALLSATGGASGNAVTFALDPSSGAGVCSVSGDTVSYLAAGTCVIDASQAGDTDYSAAPAVSQTITVDQAPSFTADSPPLSVVSGQAYSYTFTASGAPAPGYALAAGAPSWLSIDAATGAVTGTPPAGTTSFSYAVTASNSVGTTTAGPYTVTVTAASTKADISAALACPAAMTVGSTGTCTLTVANAGPAVATGVAAGLDLPAELSELSCTPGCADVDGLLIWTMPSLAAGASQVFTVRMRATAAGKVTLLAAAASQSPDPDPFNNIAVQVITITR
jgi:hypothetical protein